MTEIQAKKLLLILEGSYPRFKFTDTMIQAYTFNLVDLPYQLASMAVRDLTRTLRFPPTPAEIRERCVLIAHDLPEVDAAWAEVREKAMGFSPYGGPRTTYSSELVKEAVKAIGGIEALAYSERPEMMARQFKEAFERLRTGHIENLQRQSHIGLPPGAYEGQEALSGQTLRSLPGGAGE